MPIRILLVDDHKIVRDGLRAILSQERDLEVSGEAENGKEALRLAREALPNVVLMDVSMPVMDGVEATKHLRVGFPELKVIALTARTDTVCLDSMLMAGASGFLTKDCPADEVIRAIRTVVAGKSYISPDVAGVIMSGYVGMMRGGNQPTEKSLTPVEAEVVKLLAEGRNAKEIAVQLSISTKTVEARRRALMEKLGVRSVAELTKYAIRKGLTSLEP